MIVIEFPFKEKATEFQFRAEYIIEDWELDLQRIEYIDLLTLPNIDPLTLLK